MPPFDVNNIFNVSQADDQFTGQSLEVFRYQYQHNAVYREWCSLMNTTPDKVKTLLQIPALPVSFFKTHKVVTTTFEAEAVFESSGTTQSTPSRHFVKDLSLYKRSFTEAFSRFYGGVSGWCILGLLPSYLERQHSSLVLMVEELIRLSGHPDSGFYLHDHGRLADTLDRLEAGRQKTLLIGVTFALLDFAEAFPMKLKHTTVMETGGMKGRRKEMTREEVHEILFNHLGVASVHSEYGMTELLSQAYSFGNGRFRCPPWMRVLIRDEEDPLAVRETGRGLLQVVDLANVYSSSFIAIEDLGEVYADGSFEVWGRMDHSDLRGCSLMVV